MYQIGRSIGARDTDEEDVAGDEGRDEETRFYGLRVVREVGVEELRDFAALEVDERVEQAHHRHDPVLMVPTVRITMPKNEYIVMDAPQRPSQQR